MKKKKKIRDLGIDFTNPQIISIVHKGNFIGDSIEERSHDCEPLRDCPRLGGYCRDNCDCEEDSWWKRLTCPCEGHDPCPCECDLECSCNDKCRCADHQECRHCPCVSY